MLPRGIVQLVGLRCLFTDINAAVSAARDELSNPGQQTASIPAELHTGSYWEGADLVAECGVTDREGMGWIVFRDTKQRIDSDVERSRWVVVDASLDRGGPVIVGVYEAEDLQGRVRPSSAWELLGHLMAASAR